MLIAYLCRFGHQDAHKLLGVERLTKDQMRVLTHCIGIWMEKEFSAPEGPDKRIEVND